MNADTPPCPRCTSARTVKNGHIHNCKQNHKCKDCGRQFAEDPQNKIISKETKGFRQLIVGYGDGGSVNLISAEVGCGGVRLD
jgi:transposase-like protein